MNSFKFRLLLSILVLSVGLIIGFSVVLAVHNSFKQHQEALAHQSQVHGFVSNELVEVVYAGNPDVAANLIQKLERVMGLQGVWVENKQQQVVFGYQRPELKQQIDSSVLASVESHWLKGVVWRHEPITLYGQTLGTAHYWYQTPSFFSNLIDYAQLSILLLPLIAILALVFAHRVANHFMRPHEQLLDAIQAPESVHGAVLLPEEGLHTEVAQLFRGFNALQRRVNLTHEALEEKVRQRTHDLTITNSELLQAQQTLALAHQQIRDSIEYGSLIQHTLLPEDALFKPFFNEHFVFWEPKDTVGGDIYFLEPLASDDECFLMMVDCTGHGVPGAFVTMLVKAIERHLVARMINGQESVSPASVLAIFNRSMKHLLKQDDVSTSANAGFDGAVLHFNKRTGTIKFAGAETSLFVSSPSEAGVKEIKGNRHSVGYRQSDSDFNFLEHVLQVESGTQIYISTDGYFDQNGGAKGFPMGKKRLMTLMDACKDQRLQDQQTYFEKALLDYQGDHQRNDDITLISLKF